MKRLFVASARKSLLKAATVLGGLVELVSDLRWFSGHGDVHRLRDHGGWLLGMVRRGATGIVREQMMVPGSFAVPGPAAREQGDDCVVDEPGNERDHDGPSQGMVLQYRRHDAAPAARGGPPGAAAVGRVRWQERG